MSCASDDRVRAVRDDGLRRGRCGAGDAPALCRAGGFHSGDDRRCTPGRTRMLACSGREDRVGRVCHLVGILVGGSLVHRSATRTGFVNLMGRIAGPASLGGECSLDGRATRSCFVRVPSGVDPSPGREDRPPIPTASRSAVLPTLDSPSSIGEPTPFRPGSASPGAARLSRP